MRYHSTIKFIATLLFVSTLSACAHYVVVNVNAITDPNVSGYGTHYYLFNANYDANSNDLYFQEFRIYFDHLLQKQGYIKADSRDDADLEIQFYYGVSDGRTAYQTFAWPIYETFGGDTVTVTEKITDSSGKTSTIRRTVYIPSYVRQVGSSIETRSYTIFNRYVNLAAFPLEKTERKTATPVWNVNIHSVGESDDLRAIMPYLAAASVPFLGKNSGRQQSVTLKPDDPLVVELRKLVVNP